MAVYHSFLLALPVEKLCYFHYKTYTILMSINESSQKGSRLIYDITKKYNKEKNK